MLTEQLVLQKEEEEEEEEAAVQGLEAVWEEEEGVSEVKDDVKGEEERRIGDDHSSPNIGSAAGFPGPCVPPPAWPSLGAQRCSFSV